MIQPKRNNVQKQKLTVLLRSIISEYPAGGGVLRELCQNADDAGATKIVFVLDENTYTEEPLLHDGLQEYQGPALLAYNNRQFSDEDFESLSNIGDSRKIKDPASTGKFGRGFNSVYNWTDCPSILSGDSLVLLDPHEGWSKTTSCPGGPTYDFVTNCDYPAMRNQLAAFQEIETDFGHRFDGTIIRLPLRTNDQASRSEVCKKPTTVQNIKEVFSKFKEEILETLLFLRNVRSITLKIGHAVFSSAEASSYHVPVSGDRVPSNSSGEIQNPYLSVLVEKKEERWDDSFITEIKLLSGGKESMHTFAITHHMRHSVADTELGDWARKAKMFPWVAIAAPLNKTDRKTGRLFSTLPLPVHTRHPVHIHGMFSITPDRANIHNGEDSAASDTSDAAMGARWNKWLFTECVTEAWLQNLKLLDLLVVRNDIKFTGWDYWPVGKQGPGHQMEHGTQVLRRLMSTIVDDNIKLLPTILGSTGSARICLYATTLSRKYRKACEASNIPIVLPPTVNEFEYKDEDLCEKLRKWSPKTLRSYINGNVACFNDLDIETLQTILDIMLADKDFEDIGKCLGPLLPLKDGSYGTFEKTGTSKFKLAITNEEADLFSLSNDSTVDHSKLSTTSYEKLITHAHRLCNHTSIRRWDLRDAARYSNAYVCTSLDQSREIVEIAAPEQQKWIKNMWEWAAGKIGPGNSGLDLTAHFSGLHLLPLKNQRYRKIGRYQWSTLDVSGPTAFAKILSQPDATSSSRHYPLYSASGLSSEATQFLHACGLLTKCDDVVPLLTWLCQAHECGFFGVLSEGQRLELVRELGQLFMRAGRGHVLETMKALCSQLPLFHKANDRITEQHGNTGLLSFIPSLLGSAPKPSKWSTLTKSNTQYLGVDSRAIKVPLPENGVIFIDVSNPGEAQILSRITGQPSLTLGEVLNSYIMPAITSHPGRVEQDSPEIYQLCCFAMRHLEQLHDSYRSQLSRKAFVPTTSAIRTPCELVHPGYPVARLLFEDEDRFPAKELLANFESPLKRLGMVTDIDSTFIIDRITAFEKYGDSYDAVREKVRLLLTSTPPHTPLGDPHVSKKWLPACSPEGEKVLCSVLECRDKSWSKALHYAINIAPFDVGYQWQKFLSWDTLPSKELIRTQLLAVAEKQDNDSLRELLQRGLLQPLSLTGELQKITWVPGSSGRYFKPSTVFKANADFPPYMDTVNREFWELLSKSGLCTITHEPSFEQLHQALEAVSNRNTALETDELRLVTKLLAQVTRRYPKGDFSSFKVPDTDGYMRSIDVLTADFSNDPNDRHLKFLHRDVTTGTSQALKIPTSKDRMLQSLANSEDFAQEEDSIEMIKDSLQRYPIESTFNEYLANAEDSGSATEISWLIDWATYDNRRVLTPELALFQGPSLLSYNDGVFTEDDLKALIRIGVGSKGEDASKLGRFGRGSLTMYHWTCVPMILSGEYLVIFDPQRERLQKEFHSRRRCAGTKIRIADVRREYPDQLKPFEGASFGFTDQDSFDGTIFRFPLLGEALDVLSPTQPTQATARTHLEKYFQEASHSLIFLQKVQRITISERAGAFLSTKKPLWEVSASDHKQKKVSLTLLAIESVNHTTKPESKETSRWLVERDSERDHGIPGPLGKLRELHRLQARYGVAISDEPLKVGKVFMDLPLRKIETELPIFWTADMVLQSNRESVALGRGEEGSEWNHWIIREKVVPLYLFALEELTKAAANPATILEMHWPPVIPESEKKSHDVITNLVSQYFWEKVVESSCRIYPCQSSKRILRRDEALFSFLDAGMSSILCQILPMFGHKNIVTLSGAAAKGFLDAGLHKHSDFRSITPQFVRTLLSNRVHAAQMPDICAQSKKLLFGPTMHALLDFILSDQPDPAELTGCYAIPLKDNSLGMISTSATAGKYLLRNDSVIQMELLRLKPNMCTTLGPATARKLLEAFNLEFVTFEHVPRLLEGISTSMSSYPQILTWVWSSLTKTLAQNTQNGHPLQVQERRFKQLLKGVPVLAASAPNEKLRTFHSLEELDSHQQPLVLAQNNAKAQRLLDCFPGLKCIDRKTYVQSRLDREEITEPFGFSRLMSCLEILGASQGLEVYLEEALQAAYGDDRQEVLQLLSSVDLKGLDITSCCVSPFTVLAQFPIWAVFESGHMSYRSGTKLTLSPDDSNDWSKVAKKACFLNPSYQLRYSSKLETMGVKRIGVQEFLEQHLGAIAGAKLSPAELPNYVEFFEWFSRSHAGGDYTIVIDGNRNFKRLSDGDLYDSGVSLFVAAFRGTLEKTRFLHPRIRKYGSTVQGLVRNLDIETIHDCALAIHARYESDEQPGDSEIYADAKTVFENLGVGFLPTQANRNKLWRATAMLQMQFAPVASTFPSSYRRARMLQLVPRKSVAVLRDAISPANMRIAWSQSPILSCAPPAEIANLLRQDHTFPTKVLEHLRYLASHHAHLTREEIPEFCEDLEATYRFLADNIPYVANTLRADEAVWLNIEDPVITTADLQSSWTSASNLVVGLNYDSGDLRQVCGFLRPYTAQNGLLVKCGMKTVKQSKPLPTPVKQGLSHAEILRDEYISFRRAGKYTDFVLRVEDDSAEKFIRVHRAVLAAGSPMFRKMLDSNMKESGSGVMEVGGFTYESVMAVVEYIYSGELTTPEDKEVREMLDFYLELLRAGDKYCMAEMKEKVQAKVSSPEYLRPETVREIKEAAEAHKAAGLLAVCRKYEMDNRDIVEKAMEEQE